MNTKVTRFEVIDSTGRAYVREGCAVELSYQDEGRTLKVFVREGAMGSAVCKIALTDSEYALLTKGAAQYGMSLQRYIIEVAVERAQRVLSRGAEEKPARNVGGRKKEGAT